MQDNNREASRDGSLHGDNAMNSIYYAVYDIVANDTRESVIHILKDAGFIRIQKSVFCGKISNQQKKDLIERIQYVIDLDADSFYLIMSCNQCFGKITLLGKNFDIEYASGNKASLVF